MTSLLRSYLETPARQAATLRSVGHRPWPLPEGTWIQGQTWLELLFAHWRVDAKALRPLVPNALELDVRDGSAWIAVTPFVLTGLRLVGTLPLPRLSTFPELNVRTYVTFGDKPGIFFFSLDAGSRLTVEGARRFYRLPYYFAAMSSRRAGRRIEFASERRDRRGPDARFRASIKPDGERSEPEPGSLVEFLVERYCLYSVDDEGRPLRAEIHHPPWQLRTAGAEIEVNTMVPRELDVSSEEPLLHFSDRQDVLVWKLRSASDSSSEAPGPSE